MADGQFPPWTEPTPPSGPPRRHLVLVAVLVIAAVGAVGGLVAVIANQPDREPAATAGPDDGATDTAVRPTPSRSAVPRIGRRIDLDELAEQVARIRELPLRRRLRARVVRQRTLAQKVSDLAFSELDPKEVAADERLLVALRLAPPGTDLAQIMEALYREQILGLYVPEERMLYVKGGADRGSAAQRLTSAHEIAHALQDQAFDLVTLQEAVEDDSEASLALLSLIEGDAVLTAQLWSEQHQTLDERQQAQLEAGTGGEALAAAPDYLRASLFFPYQHGVTFVVELFRSGGYGAVDAAFADPPTTSEQILHPQKYLAEEGPADIAVAGGPGQGWRRDASYPLGEFDVQQMLMAVGPAQAEVVANGWGGGQVRSWTRDGATAVGFALAFDTAQDASEACDALPRWYAQVANGRPGEPGLYRGDRDHLALDCKGSEIFAGLAPDSGLARRLAGLD